MAFQPSVLQQATLYKFRYVLGYGFIIVLLLFIINADIANVPNGLSQAEMQQAVASTSMHLSWDMSWVFNGVFNFIQNLSIEAFGLTRLSLVLPSLFFGLCTIALFSLTMRHWFRDSVAVVATVITMTSIPFITMMRSGTPEIMLAFWTMLFLYGSVKLLVKKEKAFAWKLLVLVAGVGLIYTPFGIYVLAPILGSAFFHPHVRSRFRHIKRARLLALAIIGTVLLTPLGIYLVSHPSHIDSLLGLSNLKEGFLNLRQHVSQLFTMYGNFMRSGFAGVQIIPVYNLATVVLALFGLLKSIRDRFMARSYVLLAWVVVTAVIALLIPEAVVITFVPVSLLMAIGIDTLILEWYRLFPRNPYARTAGLIPLTILFLGIASGNIAHYFDTYNHVTNTSFNQALPAIKSSLVMEGDHAVVLVAHPDDVAFYSILKQDFRYLNVTSELPSSTTAPVFIVPNSGKSFAAVPSRIVTSGNTDDSAVLRIYRPQ
jgi:4-amino-4-deoxy-L-arabinose transferase-like glycosyltransferase